MLNDSNTTRDNDNVNASSPSATPQVDSLIKRLDDQERQIAELRRQVRMARGTRDLEPEQTLEQKIETALREKIWGVAELAREVNQPLTRVASAIGDLRRAGKIYNVGTEDRARWTWRIGDGTSTEELTALIRRLLTDQPMHTAELVAATGARPQRVSGVIVAIQRSGAKILDIGGELGRGRWFLIGPAARDAKLPAKGVK